MASSVYIQYIVKLPKKRMNCIESVLNIRQGYGMLFPTSCLFLVLFLSYTTKLVVEITFEDCI